MVGHEKTLAEESSASVFSGSSRALGLLYLGRVLSVRLLRLLAASVDELGKLCAGALEDRAQLGLFLCIAVGGPGCRHEEPCDFCRSAA